jgi:hypothetical protein
MDRDELGAIVRDSAQADSVSQHASLSSKWQQPLLHIASLVQCRPSVLPTECALLSTLPSMYYNRLKLLLVAYFA